jgi:hypothetical protein
MSIDMHWTIDTGAGHTAQAAHVSGDADLDALLDLAGITVWDLSGVRAQDVRATLAPLRTADLDRDIRHKLDRIIETCDRHPATIVQVF